jgi:hypothetical protein
MKGENVCKEQIIDTNHCRITGRYNVGSLWLAIVGNFMETDVSYPNNS